MALSEKLPLYQQTVDFQRSIMIHFTQIRNLHKHTLGTHVYDAALTLTLMIRRANRCVNEPMKKVAILEDYIDTVEDIGSALRLAHDTGIINDKAHALMSGKIPYLCKQATSWRNKTMASISAPSGTGREQVFKGCSVDTSEGETTYE